MAKEILQNENATFVVSYRAVCTKGDYNGQKRATKAEALRDALKHQDQNLTHNMRLVVEQTQTMSFDIGKG